MCRVYGVTRAGFYAWCNRAIAPAKQDNERVLQKIRAIHLDSELSYGSPRVHAALRQQGECISVNRTARIMRAARIRAHSAGLYRPNPGHHAFFANIPNRSLDVLADAPNRVWVGDVTYLRLADRWLYLAVVMDKYSRRIVGWAIGRDRTARLVIRALDQAVQLRRPPPGTIFHSDRGIEYVSYLHRDRLAHHGLVQSMNRVNRMNDNAFMESFFHSMKTDRYHGRVFTTERELVTAVRTYMPFYNMKRLHSSIGYVAPAAFEAKYAN
jgi:transposase InsO family protein